MKQNLLLIGLLAGLTWVAQEHATVARIRNLTKQTVKIYTQNRRCGDLGWGWLFEEIQPGQWLDLCNAGPVSGYVVRVEGQEPTVFMEHGRDRFMYSFEVPTAQDWILYVVGASRAGGNIDGRGALTQKAIDKLAAGTVIEKLTPEDLHRH